MTSEDLRFYFLITALLVLALYKIGEHIYRRGRQSVLRERFSFTLQRDNSARERL
jgi:hypothetical protein